MSTATHGADDESTSVGDSARKASKPCSAEDLFAGSALGLRILTKAEAAVRSIGPYEMRVSKSQIAFRRRRGFAYVWRPDRYLRTEAPAVLSIALPFPLASSRFKEVAHPSSRVWMHHLELRRADQLDDEVTGWLRAAYEAAG